MALPGGGAAEQLDAPDERRGQNGRRSQVIPVLNPAPTSQL